LFGLKEAEERETCEDSVGLTNLYDGRASWVKQKMQSQKDERILCVRYSEEQEKLFLYKK
jgi:hypothetical protein